VASVYSLKYDYPIDGNQVSIQPTVGLIRQLEILLCIHNIDVLHLKKIPSCSPVRSWSPWEQVTYLVDRSEDLQQVPLSPDQGSRRVQEAKLRSWGVFAKRPIFAWVNGDLEPWGKVEFVMRMFSSPQIAGLISAIIVLIVIVAIGFLLEPLQKVALIPQADISLLRWWIEGSGS